MVKIFCKETILGAFVSLMIHGKEANQDWCIDKLSVASNQPREEVAQCGWIRSNLLERYTGCSSRHDIWQAGQKSRRYGPLSNLHWQECKWFHPVLLSAQSTWRHTLDVSKIMMAKSPKVSQ